MRELNESNFKDEIKNMKLALVDFYATWCGPCGMQAKVLDKIQNLCLHSTRTTPCSVKIY